MLDDVFTLIAHDGARLLEIVCRVIVALASLAAIDADKFGQACAMHAALLVKRAERALPLEEDRARLQALAKAAFTAL